MKPSTTGQRGRPASVQARVSDELRRLIQHGDWRASGRLPTRAALAAQLGVSLMTVQRAMARLEQDGWIQSRGSAGTVVTWRAPIKRNYALLLPFPAEHPLRFTLFHRALVAAARQIERSDDCGFELVYGDAGQFAAADVARLTEAIAAERVSGLIHADYPAALIHTPLWHPKLRVPVAALTVTGECLGVPAISFSQAEWTRQALDLVVREGCKRVAILTPWSHDSEMMSMYRRQLAERQFTGPDWWQMYLHPYSAASARDWMQMLVALPPARRPDALLIADDNLVERATAGVAEAGARLFVVAHYNAPLQPQTHVPVQWLGNDCVAMLRQARAVIEAQRRGDNVATRTVVPPVIPASADRPASDPSPRR